MSERTVSVAEAKSHLSELIAAVEAGDEVFITKPGSTVQPVVDGDLGVMVRGSDEGMPGWPGVSAGLHDVSGRVLLDGG